MQAGPFPGRGEDEWVAALAGRLAPTGVPGLGIGHDCAAVDLQGAAAVVSTDVLVDGVHFRLAECGGRAAAGKALRVNLSDLAAAAAEPVAWFLGLVLPSGAPQALREELLAGLEEVARTYGVPCAGGDTNVAHGPLTLAVTVLGRPGPLGVVRRSGARVGDVLSVTGPLGGSLGGRHLLAEPRLREALALARLGVPHAMMDLSDGLSRDLPRLCQASGVGARVDARAVPVHDDAVRAATTGRSPLEHALDDGEDFELLVAHAELDPATRARLEEAGVRLTPIGRVVAQTQGIRLADARGSVPLAPRGFDHLAPAEPSAGARGPSA
jgi:thiamine-monophosphate kinase